MQVLHVVFSLVKGFVDAKLDALPVLGLEGNLVLVTASDVVLSRRRLVKVNKDGFAGARANLFDHAGEFSHALFPVLELHDGAGVFVRRRPSGGLRNVTLNFLLPALEHASQRLNGVVVVGLLARVHGLDLLKDGRVDLVQLNLVVE